MDQLPWPLSSVVSTAQEIASDLIAWSKDPSLLWEEIKNIDPGLGGVMLIVTTLLLGFVAMVTFAHFTEAPLPPNRDEVGVLHKADAPPVPPPTEIVALYIYPIKSCRGFEVTSTRLRKTGLTLDRNWMFIDQKTRKFLTIRENSNMTLIDTEIVEDPDRKEQMLRISISGGDADQSATIPAFPTKDWLTKYTTLSKCEIWEEETDAYEYPEEINSVFTKFFGKPVALVYKGPTVRMMGVNGRKELYGSNTSHHFADVMSLLIASDASITDLNRRMDSKAKSGSGDKKYPSLRDLTIERFRPNIIVRGRPDHPWEEDTWKRVRIITKLDKEEALYRLELDVVARCARCQVPNVDPETAFKHPREPWDELMKFRRVDPGKVAKWKPCFGMLAIPKNEGVIQVGAKLVVLETTDKHLFDTAKFSDL